MSSTARCASSGVAPPIRTSKPLPKPLLGTLDKLHRHLPVGLGTTGAPVVMGQGEAVARRLRDAHGARDDGVEHERAEVLAYLRLDVGREPRAAVDHRQENAGD